MPGILRTISQLLRIANRLSAHLTPGEEQIVAQAKALHYRRDPYSGRVECSAEVKAKPKPPPIITFTT